MKRMKLGCLALYLVVTVAVGLTFNLTGYEPFAWSAREIWLVCLGAMMGWVGRSLEEYLVQSGDREVSNPEDGRVA